MTPGRRAADDSLLVFGRRIVAGEAIVREIRVIALIYGLAFTIWGGSLIFFHDARAYQNPIFDGLFTAALPQVWGTAFWTVACAMFATAIGGRAVMYLIAVILAVGFYGGWAAGVICQWILDPDATLTGGALALYMIGFTGLGSTVTMKRAIEFEREILERTPSGDVVPLVPADRRVS